jgi:hypothetical protein
MKYLSWVEDRVHQAHGEPKQLQSSQQVNHRFDDKGVAALPSVMRGREVRLLLLGFFTIRKRN